MSRLTLTAAAAAFAIAASSALGAQGNVTVNSDIGQPVHPQASGSLELYQVAGEWSFPSSMPTAVGAFSDTEMVGSGAGGTVRQAPLAADPWQSYISGH